MGILNPKSPENILQKLPKNAKKTFENHKNTASKYEEYGSKVFLFILPAVSDFSPATVSYVTEFCFKLPSIIRYCYSY